MDDQLYDEFGNYIGPELQDSDQELEREDEEEQVAQQQQPQEEEEEEDMMMMREETTSQAVVLHEDKNYYPSASDIFGEEVETMVEDEDAQAIETPIIQPMSKAQWDIEEREIPETTYNKQYMIDLMNHPDLIRNVAIAGHLHHGKTNFVDMLVRSTHKPYQHIEKSNQELRYTDTRIDEQQRGISLKCRPMTLLLPNSYEKSYLFNVMDTPGHTNFSDEIACAFRISDGVVLVVDALEGVMSQTEHIIEYAIQEQLPMCLLITKVDRLILELRLPPTDAYYKLKHTISEVNNLIEKYTMTTSHFNNFSNTSSESAGNGNNLSNNIQYMIPQEGNVCFASSLGDWCFTLPSFAKLYADYYTNEKGLDPNRFAKRLWGDVYYHEHTRRFMKKPASDDANQRRSFVQFILEPLYKIYSHLVGQEGLELAETIQNLGVRLRKIQLKELNMKPLIKLVFNGFFGGQPRAFVDMVTQFIPPPGTRAIGNRVGANSSKFGSWGNRIKVKHCYTGPQDSEIARQMINCDPKGTLMIHITKLYHKPNNCSQFDAFGRIMSGTIHRGETVRVLFETFTQQDEEELADCDASALWLLCGRYRLELDKAPAGTWVLIEGIDNSILKTATVTTATNPEPYIFRPLTFNTRSVVKIAVEPLNPSELPKMVEGLRRINKSYPLVSTKVEESGEHVILGTGELYLDVVMHDLRQLYGNIEVKVADPVVTLCETVIETSSIKCYAESANKQNRLSMICQPLEKKLAQDIEHNRLTVDQWSRWDRTTKNAFFKEHYNWDALAVNSLWAFGPEPNVLLNETFSHEVDTEKLNSIKDSIIQGFNWGTREGPLCDEPIRNVKFKLIDATIADKPIHRGSGQIIPTARRVVYQSFLTATPRLMEPVYEVEIIAPLDTLSAITKVLERRRGNIIHDVPKPGTPLYIVKAYVPVMDSFGLETDIRSHTQGQAFCLSMFSHFQIAPGDPLEPVVLRPLEPSPPQHLAREYLVKTRRRKGLSDDVSIVKYFDEPLIMEIAKQGMLSSSTTATNGE
jgi:U5 small nuclear ribonucleoprotein component